MCNFWAVPLKGGRRVPAPPLASPSADWNIVIRAGGGAAILDHQLEDGRATR